jgi:hypothetical protein
MHLLIIILGMYVKHLCKIKLHYNFGLFLPFTIHIVLWLFVQAILV